MSRNGFSIFVGIFLILMLTLIKTNSTNNKYENKISLLKKSSIIDDQRLLENNFEAEGYTLDNPNVIVNPYGISPLTALVMFETKDEVTPNITIKGKDELTTFNGFGSKGNLHYVPIYGLYPDIETEVIITIKDQIKKINIKADKLPKEFAMPTKAFSKKDKLTDRLYFSTSSNDGYTAAYDVNGDVRWYLTEKMSWNIKRLKNGRMLLSTERSINNPYSTTGLYEVDLLGKVYKEYSLPGGYHHDFFEMENGNILIASNDFDSKFDTVEDYIVELDRETGNIIKTWDLKNYLNIKSEKNKSCISYDWFHNNSIWYDKKDNAIILSGKHKNAVVAIDYNTGKPVWIIGDSNEWDDKYKHLFFKPINKNLEWPSNQHSVKFVSEEDILLLDNGTNKVSENNKYVSVKNKSTRGIMYKINKEKRTIKQLWQYNENGVSLNTSHIADVNYQNNHHLIYSGKEENASKLTGFNENAKSTSTIIELLNGEIIYELSLPMNVYHVEKMSLYNHSKFEMGKGVNLGTLGKTKSSKEGFRLPKDAINTDDFYDSHNITFTNEHDRLVMSGNFKKNSDVKVILYRNFHVKEYDVKVNRNSNTSLCFDLLILNKINKDIKVDKYINKEGLNGEHSIYLKIDNKIYRTNYKIDFNK